MSLDHRPRPEGSMRKAVTMLVMGGYAGSVITEGGWVAMVENRNRAYQLSS